MNSQEDEADLFIPLRHSDLIGRLIADLQLGDVEREQYKLLCQKLVAIFHAQHLAALIELEDLYSPLDPDGEAIDLTPDRPEEMEQNVEAVLARLTSLLQAAHYEHLTEDTLKEAIEIGGEWNVRLDIDFSIFDRLLVYARGYRRVKLSRRLWYRFYREETVEFPEFQRLVMAFRLKPSKRLDPSLKTDVLYLKVFKNIPESELEVLLPGSQVRFSLFDRGKILLPTLSGAALLIYKIVQGALAVTLITIVAIWQWLVLIAVLTGYLVRSFLSYLGTKNKYQLGLTRNLYLKNLDNNSGVIYRVFNEAEEQELCETVLAYSMFFLGASRGPLSESELRERVEAFLKDSLGRRLRFDVHDALGKLVKLGLVEIVGPEHWQATPLSEAPKVLERNWDQIFSRSQGFWRQSRKTGPGPVS
jgi:hypothetical protein